MNEKIKERVSNELEKELEKNNRAFILMIDGGRANVFRDLNKRYERLKKQFGVK